MSYQRYINDLAERKSIIIRQVDVDYGDMKNFASYCKQLEKITFEKCSGVHHSMMNDLFRNNRSINEIVFVDCARFGHDCFEHLRSIRSSLRLLDLTGYNLSDCEQSSILRVGLDNLETIIFGYPFRHIHLFYHYYPRCKVIFKLRSDRISDTETEMEKQQALDQVARFRRSREKQMQRTNEIMMGNLTLSENQPSSSAQPSARHVNDRTEKKLLDDYKKEIRRLRRSRIKQQFPRDSSDSSLDSSDTSMSQFGKSTSSSSSSGGAASRNQKRMQKKTERRKSRSPNKR